MIDLIKRLRVAADNMDEEDHPATASLERQAAGELERQADPGSILNHCRS
jgi:hypothetical protein